MTVRVFQSQQRRFVVLDRDGTIIEEREYLSEPEQVKLIPGVAAALRELRQMGFGLVVITNQSGVGRGIFDQAQLERVHQRLEELFQAEGIHLDGLYVCPHTPDDDCACRKPKLGLLQEAADGQQHCDRRQGQRHRNGPRGRRFDFSRAHGLWRPV